MRFVSQWGGAVFSPQDSIPDPSRAAGRDAAATVGIRSALAIGIALIVLSSCKRPQPVGAQTHLIRGWTMGTTYAVKVPAYDGMPDIGEISRRIDDVLRNVNGHMSTYDPDSSISVFNRWRRTEWMEVPADVAGLVARAQRLAEISNGKFDITVKPLVDLWGFGAAGPIEAPPTAEQVRQALDRVGYRKLEVRLDPPALRKSDPYLEIDLSGIAKGYGVDRVAQALDAIEAPAYFIEIGGEVRTKGRRADGGGWRVGIERPVEDRREILRVVELVDASMATSGDYRNFFLGGDGKRFHHTIDPTTGYPVQDPIAAATAVAEQCTWADAVATCMMAMGFDQGVQLAEREQWAVMLVGRRDGELAVAASSRFEALFPGLADDRGGEDQ